MVYWRSPARRPYAVQRSLPGLRQRLAVAPREIDDLASWLPVPLPSGYRDYLTTLGVGTFCDLVCIHPPKTVRDTMEEHHGFIAEYYRQFWRRGEGTLPFERAIHSVRFATSCDGDLFGARAP